LKFLMVSCSSSSRGVVSGITSAWFNMLGAISQFETEIRAERQMDGIQNGEV